MRWLLLLVALNALLLAFRVISLKYNATDLFFDEAQYWSWSLEPAFGYYSKPPLIAWLIGVATSVCGASEMCIRLPAPILHAATSLVVFLVGQRLYDARAGFAAGLAYLTLPGVSVSSGIISTDVPLLFCWALALLGLVGMLETDRWGPTLLLGLGLGLGLNAKYAMLFFLGCLAVYLLATPERRGLLKDARLYAALAIGAALIAPNMMWNAKNSFATFSHTADNANWGRALVNPLKGLEFIASQFGVFGPILFAALIAIAWSAWKRGLPEGDRLLLAFSLPVIAVIAAQGFVSRAHPNWAATAYIAATVLVAGTLLRDGKRVWLTASLGLHLAFLPVLAAGLSQAGTFRLPAGGGDPFARTLGWHDVAAAARTALEAARRDGRPFAAVVTDDRAVTAELLYYMQGEPTPVMAWRLPGVRPADHYELTRAYDGKPTGPVLLVSLRRDAGDVPRHFTQVALVREAELPAGTERRRIRLIALDGYAPRPPEPRTRGKPKS